MVGWLRRAAVALAALALLTGGAAAIGAAPANAAEDAKRSCIYEDKEYSHGAINPVGGGILQICNNGEWDVYTPPSEPGEPIEPREP
jgi:hypothetical protein